MTRTVSITLENNGAAVTDATVTLSDEAAAHGIREADGTVVVAAGTPMPHVGGGVYRYAFTAAEAGVEYHAVARVAWANGDVDYVDRELDAAAPGTGSNYASREHLEMKKGVEAVKVASRVAPGGTAADADRILAALAEADVRIDEFLARNGLVTPVTDETMLRSLSAIAVDLAWAFLLDPAVFNSVRAPEDAGPGRDLYFSVRAATRRLQLLAMFPVGDPERLTDAPTYPTPVD